MRYRLMATYRGVPYEVGVGPSNTDVVLFAACPPPEELGFEPATGHWRKAVIRAEIDAMWESRPVGVFRGEPCIVLDDLGERLHIAYLGTDADRAAHLGYWQVDRGVFELLTARGAVMDYNDPYFPSLPKTRHYDFSNMRSMDLTPECLASYDCVLIATDHSSYDYDSIVRSARLVVDTRNATRAVTRNREKIVRC